MKILARGIQIVLVIAVASASYAAASSLGLATDTLAAGSSAVMACDPDGVALSYTVVDGKVTDVTVDGLHADCVGGDLSLTLVDSTGAGIGSGGPQVVDASSETVSISPQPANTSVDGSHVVVLGP